jgi:hypothetical protein
MRHYLLPSQFQTNVYYLRLLPILLATSLKTAHSLPLSTERPEQFDKSNENLAAWRRRVEVESTIRPAKDRIAGFEGRGSHRTPFASGGSIAGDLIMSSGQRGGAGAACCATTRDGAMKVKRSHSRRECSWGGFAQAKAACGSQASASGRRERVRLRRAGCGSGRLQGRRVRGWCRLRSTGEKWARRFFRR